MKSRLIWKKSWNNNDKDSFWIECTDQEVIDNILPLKSDLEFLERIAKNKESSKISTNENEKNFCNFFLISTDLKDIQSYNWVYPYSGMWNASNPFEEIDVIDFDNLKELKILFEKIQFNTNE
jgi:hypothetical protein